jgi:AcrR family transcriptional regulator
MERRSYRQTRRAEATEATRQRIVQAALDQLLSGDAFTIEAVAIRAGVSRVTVYAQFGNRDLLGEAVFDHLGQVGGLSEIPSAFAQADLLEAIGRLIEIFYGFYATHRIILRRLNALAVLSTGDDDRPRDRNARRRQILTVLLSRAAQEEGYAGLDLETTVGTLQALTSFEFYDQLAANVPTIEPTAIVRALASALLEVPGHGHGGESR